MSSSAVITRPERIGNNEPWPVTIKFVKADGTDYDCTGWTMPYIGLRKADKSTGYDMLYDGMARSGSTFSGIVPKAFMEALTSGTYQFEAKVDKAGLESVILRGRVGIEEGITP